MTSEASTRPRSRRSRRKATARCNRSRWRASSSSQARGSLARSRSSSSAESSAGAEPIRGLRAKGRPVVRMIAGWTGVRQGEARRGEPTAVRRRVTTSLPGGSRHSARRGLRQRTPGVWHDGVHCQMSPPNPSSHAGRRLPTGSRLGLPGAGRACPRGGPAGRPLPRLLQPAPPRPHRPRRARRRTPGRPVAFELSVANVDKPDLPPEEVHRRLDQFDDHGPVFVTRAAILAKAALFPGAVFVVGADTAARVVQARYYGDDPAGVGRALDALRSHGCRFFVGGRLSGDGRFVEVGGVAIPAGYRDMFAGPDEENSGWTFPPPICGAGARDDGPVSTRLRRGLQRGTAGRREHLGGPARIGPAQIQPPPPATDRPDPPDRPGRDGRARPGAAGPGGAGPGVGRGPVGVRLPVRPAGRSVADRGRVARPARLARASGGTTPTAAGWNACAGRKLLGDRMHIRRATDTEAPRPRSTRYHYRIIYQTFYGMRDVLGPLRDTPRHGRPAVPVPPAAARPGGCVVECCPASVLKRLGCRTRTTSSRPAGR